MSEPKMNYFLTRVLAFLQCLIGFLLLAFGIVERVIVELWSSQVVIPIWVGVWVSDVILNFENIHQLAVS